MSVPAGRRVGADHEVLGGADRVEDLGPAHGVHLTGGHDLVVATDDDSGAGGEGNPGEGPGQDVPVTAPVGSGGAPNARG